MPRFLLLAVLVVAGPTARAQITVTRDGTEALLMARSTARLYSSDTAAAARAAIQPLIERRGAAQTWDFTSVPVHAAGAFAFTPVQPPQAGSDDPHFAQATHLVRSDSLGTTTRPGIGYYRLDADRLVALGSTQEGGLLKYLPGIAQPLPYTYGSSWASETAVLFDPVAFPGQQTIREESSVVGWGTLVTPGGTDSALMIATRLISRTRFEFPGMPPVESIDTTQSVTYVTGERAQVTVTLDRRGGAYRALLTVPLGTTTGEPNARPTGLRMTAAGPNPAPRGTPVEIRFTLSRSSPVFLAIFDVLGRRVATLAEGLRPAGEGQASWTTAGVPTGLYLVHLQAGTDHVSRRVVVD